MPRQLCPPLDAMRRCNRSLQSRVTAPVSACLMLGRGSNIRQCNACRISAPCRPKCHFAAAASHGGATQPPKEAQAAPPPPLAAVSAAWSPVFPTAAAGGSPAAGGDASDGAAAGGSASSGGCRAGGAAAVLLAVGTSGGLVWLWRLKLPAKYTLQHQPAGPQLELVPGFDFACRPPRCGACASVAQRSAGQLAPSAALAGIPDADGAAFR